MNDPINMTIFIIAVRTSYSFKMTIKAKKKIQGTNIRNDIFHIESQQTPTDPQGVKKHGR